MHSSHAFGAYLQVTENHQGRYSCTPYNIHTTRGSSGPMQVLVMKPPVFVLEPEKLYQRKVCVSDFVSRYHAYQECHCAGKICEFYGYPTILWLNDIDILKFVGDIFANKIHASQTR